MKELLVKHELNGKIINRFRFKPDRDDIYTVGSSRRADIRIPDEGIAPLHAGFEMRNGKWNILDLGSETGTWCENKPVIEHEIDNEIFIKIGDHSLSVTQVVVPKAEIFNRQNKVEFSGENALVKQQVAVFFQGELVESYLQEKDEVVKVAYGRKWFKIKPPLDTHWIESSMGDFLVKNRLVTTYEFVNPEKSIWNLFPKDMLKPLGYSFASTLIFFLALYIIPKALNSDPGALEENQYTKLMYDQKTIEKQKKKANRLKKELEKTKPKKEAKKAIVKKSPKKEPKASPQVKTQKKKLAKLAPSRSNIKVNAKVSKVVSSIKNSGLSSLVSKVSERASSNARIVSAKGPKASSNKGGRAFASISDVKGGAKLGAAAETGSFRVAGVSTKGVAGGSSVSSRLGGLSGSGIGSASVGAIDEETEVAGGLTAEQIARVVKQNLGAIRYCYERQLVANPNLYGKIKVEFVIGPTGRVMTQKVKNTTMNNSLVEGCILRKLRAWKFPQPTGGTEVAVSYPFYFKANK